MLCYHSLLVFVEARPPSSPFFFFNDTATTEIYTLSLHDALPISERSTRSPSHSSTLTVFLRVMMIARATLTVSVEERSEEHTSELQSHLNLVCRLLLEKKKSRSFTSITRYTFHHDVCTTLH